MVTAEGRLNATITTGNVEIDKKLGGGIPAGSLTLIEGQSDARKSVLAQHFARGGLGQDVAVAYYTTENTVKSLLTQMASLSLHVTDHFLVDRFRVYPLHISSQDVKSELVFDKLYDHFKGLPKAFKVIIIDSVTNVVTHGDQPEIIGFFINCKELCDEGLTVIMVVHSYAFDEGMLIRVRSLCDAHLKLRMEQVGERLTKMLEVSKVHNADRTTGNVLSFDVEPNMGMRIIPVTKARA